MVIVKNCMIILKPSQQKSLNYIQRFAHLLTYSFGIAFAIVEFFKAIKTNNHHQIIINTNKVTWWGTWFALFHHIQDIYKNNADCYSIAQIGQVIFLLCNLGACAKWPLNTQLKKRP